MFEGLRISKRGWSHSWQEVSSLIRFSEDRICITVFSITEKGQLDRWMPDMADYCPVKGTKFRRIGIIGPDMIPMEMSKGNVTVSFSGEYGPDCSNWYTLREWETPDRAEDDTYIAYRMTDSIEECLRDFIQQPRIRLAKAAAGISRDIDRISQLYADSSGTSALHTLSYWTEQMQSLGIRRHIFNLWYTEKPIRHLANVLKIKVGIQPEQTS